MDRPRNPNFFGRIAKSSQNYTDLNDIYRRRTSETIKQSSDYEIRKQTVNNPTIVGTRNRDQKNRIEDQAQNRNKRFKESSTLKRFTERFRVC